MNPSPNRQTLADPAVKARRVALIKAPHVAALNALVAEIRTDCNCPDCVPYFDPSDGGVEARVLFILEAPGPQAIASGFVSCDNPDLSARNMTTLLAEAGIERRHIVAWNIVPWYLGDGKKISPPTKRDRDAGLVCLHRLLPCCPNCVRLSSSGDTPSAQPAPWCYRHRSAASNPFIRVLSSFIAIRKTGQVCWKRFAKWPSICTWSKSDNNDINPDLRKSAWRKSVQRNIEEYRKCLI